MMIRPTSPAIAEIRRSSSQASGWNATIPATVRKARRGGVRMLMGFRISQDLKAAAGGRLHALSLILLRLSTGILHAISRRGRLGHLPNELADQETGAVLRLPRRRKRVLARMIRPGHPPLASSCTGTAPRDADLPLPSFDGPLALGVLWRSPPANIHSRWRIPSRND